MIPATKIKVVSQTTFITQIQEGARFARSFLRVERGTRPAARRKNFWVRRDSNPGPFGFSQSESSEQTGRHTQTQTQTRNKEINIII